MLDPLLSQAVKIAGTVSMMPFKATYEIAKATADAIIKAGKKASRIF
jgi:hypothetical protein